MKGFFIEFLHIWFIFSFSCDTKVEKLTLVNSSLHVYQCKNNKPVLIWKHIQEIARNILHSFICNKFFLFLRNDNPNHCVFFVWNFYKNYFSSRCSFTMSSLCSKKTNKKPATCAGFLLVFYLSVFMTHVREQDHVTDTWRIGKDHHQTVNTDTFTRCWR